MIFFGTFFTESFHRMSEGIIQSQTGRYSLINMTWMTHSLMTQMKHYRHIFILLIVGAMTLILMEVIQTILRARIFILII